ncbi:methyltransferase domain-containing protein [Kribbella sp. NBC_00382]|uniref:methyltransferase domain-containing protein n=1 Tax=Kribbella sp. NBC_00382 TaxID=2975967 RepID=UPI002E1AC6C3
MAEHNFLAGLRLGAGDTCVDVGCGDGGATAELVRAHVKAIGVDPDPAVIAAASARTPGAVFHVAHSGDLPLEDESVDGYHAANLFHLLPDPLPTLAEAQRVLRPGGRIALIGQDYGFLMLDSDDQDLTDVIGLGLESRWVAPRAARSYRDLLLGTGFDEVEVRVHARVTTDYGQLADDLAEAASASVKKALITREDADGWLAEQADRGRRDRFLGIAPILMVTGTR